MCIGGGGEQRERQADSKHIREKDYVHTLGAQEEFTAGIFLQTHDDDRFAMSTKTELVSNLTPSPPLRLHVVDHSHPPVPQGP